MVAGRLRVRRSYNRHGLTDAKSERSQRTVVVPAGLVAELADLQAAAAEHGEPGFVLAGAMAGRPNRRSSTTPGARLRSGPRWSTALSTPCATTQSRRGLGPGST